MPGATAAVLCALALIATSACGRSRALLPISPPDASRADPAVQRQVTDRYAALKQKLDAGAPDAELGAAFGEYAMLLHAAEFYDGARPAYLNAQALTPADPRWPYHLGHLYRSQGDTEHAAESFERVLELKPDDVPTLVWLGRLYLDDGRVEKAEPLFAKAQEHAPRSVAVLAGLGQAALARRDYMRAADVLERALQIDPDASSVRAPLATAYRGLGETQKADAAMAGWRNTEIPLDDPLTRDRTLALESGISYETRGVRAFESGQFGEAGALFRKGLDLTMPETPLGRSLRQKLALALYLNGDPGGALTQYREAIRLAPASGLDEPAAQAHYGLGVILASAGRDEEAIAHLRRAIAYNPKYAQGHSVLADLLRRNGEFADALSHYREVIALDANAAGARLGFALALTRMGRWVEARQSLDESTRALRDRPELLQPLARVLAAAPDAAARDGERSVRLTQQLLGRPDQQRTTDLGETLAMGLAEIGMFEEAVRVQRGVMQAAERAGLYSDAKHMAANLARYEQRRPCRIPWPDDDRIHRPGPPVSPGLAKLLE